jgi:hypothetical protein
MTRSGKLLLIAGALVAVAGSAYAQSPQATQQVVPQATQQTYAPGAAAMSAPAPAIDQSNPDHFVKPSGYDYNPWNYPYTRPGAGPKAN